MFINNILVSILATVVASYTSAIDIDICPNKSVRESKQTKSNACITLEEYVSTSDIDSNSTIRFNLGEHELNSTITISNKNNVQLIGANGTTATVICSVERAAGFLFLNCSNISITCLDLIGCGAEVNITGEF